MSSNETKDVHVNLSIPCHTDSGCEPDPSSCAPWGAPMSRDTGGRIAVLKQLLERIVPLLEVLQRAHREGQLAKDDLAELSRLQCWYTVLQAEYERLRQPPPPSEK